MYAIEKNIPLTSKGVSPGRPIKYPFRQMEISDSFVVPADSNEAAVPNGSSAPRVVSAAYRYGRTNGQKFSYRRDDSGNIRIWRIE